MKKSTGYATIYLLTIVLFSLLVFCISSVKSTSYSELKNLHRSEMISAKEIITEHHLEMASLEDIIRNLEGVINDLQRTPIVYDTITLGIPIARPKEYELHQEGVWITDWRGGDLTHFRFIYLIDGELFVGCNECREGSRWTLTPFSKYYVSEIEQQEALLEIIRTRTFEYDGPTLDSSHVIINEPR